MSRSALLLANAFRVATEERTREGDAEHYQCMASVAVGAAPTYAGRFFRLSGSENFAVDGSTAKVFEIVPGGSEVLRVSRLRFAIQCATAPAWDAFGDLEALANGLQLALVDEAGVAIVDLLNGERLTSNADLAALGDVAVSTLGSTHLVTATLDLTVPIRVDGGAAEALRCTVNDDLTGLTMARLRAEAVDEGALR